jgi:hypothetical protein
MKHLLLVICLSLASLQASALPVPARWTIDVSKADQPPAMLISFQGESIALQAQLNSVGVPLAFPTNSSVTFNWATNSTGPFWSAAASLGTSTGTVRYTWTPSNDIGAATYVFYFGITDTTGTIYRAYGQIRMRPSPGFNPVILPPPTTLGATLAGLSNLVYSSSNALALALQAETTRAQQAESDAVSTAIAAAGTQSAGMLLTGTAFRATSADRIVQLDTHAWVTVSAGTALLWRVTSDTNTLVVTSSYVGGWGFVPAVGSTFRRATATTFTNPCSDGVWSVALESCTWMMWSPEPWGAYGGTPEGYYNAPFGKYQVTVAYAPLACTNAYPLARLDDLPSLAPYATATQLAAVSNLALQASAAAAVAATNSVDPVARASAASKPSYANVTNIATSIVAGYAAPSFPVYDYGLRTNVTFVLSNSVLYLYGQ